MNRDVRMFCYRYWLEGRTRLLIAFVLMIFILLQALGQADTTIRNHPHQFGGRQLLFTQYVWVIVYKGYFLTIFTLASFLFGVGSPVQERASGTALFTLSLPVKRRLLIYSKLLTALLQVVALSLSMAIIIPLLSKLFGHDYPIKDALLFGALAATGGIIFMFLGFMLSLFISRETIIIPLGVAIMAALFFITKMPALKKLNIFDFMVGAGYLSNDNFLFDRSINGLAIFLICLTLSLVSYGFIKKLKWTDM